MDVLRTQTKQGMVISFDRSNSNGKEEKDPVKRGKKGPVGWSRNCELTRVMSDTSRAFLEDPLGNVGRMWVVKGKRLLDKPDKKAITKDDDE